MSAISLTRAQEQRLKQALLGDERLGVTELRVINTDVYKDRLGSDWFRYKGIINAYAVQAIKANLSVEDIFVPTKNGFAVFFLSASEDKVAAASEMMAQDISRLLADEKLFQDPPISCAARQMTRSELIDQIDVELDLGGPRAPARPGASEPMMVGDEKPSLATGERSPSGYNPLWHGKVQRVVGCINEPTQRAPFIGRKQFYESAVQHVRYDIDGFNDVLRHVYEMHKNRETAVIVFSINFASFCVPEFNKEYLMALRQTPAVLLPYLLPRFVRIPPGAPNTLIASKAQVLSSIFKKLVLQAPPDGDLKRFEYTACTMLATSIREVRRVVQQQSVVSFLTSFVITAKSMRYNALVTGVDTQEAFEAAVQAKADFVSGAAIGPQTRLPASQFQLSASEIRGTARGDGPD